jgi:AraC-like DNA-binding protein
VPKTALPSDEAAAAEELLRGMRWSASGFAQDRVMAGHSRRLRSSGTRFLHVGDGAVTLLSHGAGSADRFEGEVSLQGGDFVLLPRGGDVELRASATGPGALVLGGDLTLEAARFERITDLMPPVLFTCGFRTIEPVYGALLDTIATEISAGRPGSATVLTRLLDLVVSATLRTWLERGCASANLWLAQLRDPHLAKALDAIHADPGSPWTVETLARVASASRSTFAERFRNTVGESPARYVARVRMRRAQELLRAGWPVSKVSFALGYDSDEGFRRAFHRHFGRAPSDWRREMERAPA